mmetsp:Transcript_25951/g.55789  ORF Transcript_25951/g.55789 Transcript_25951/m.55789 type:complete len:492 (-) Transcript_25951:760-2235(-)
MGTKVKDGISVEDLFKECVVSSKSVMRTGRLSEEKTHRIPLVSEGRLHTNEDISELLSVDNKVLSIRVEVTRGRSPVLLKVLGIRSFVVVFLSAHAVSNIQLGGVDTRLRIIQDTLHDGLFSRRCFSNIITLSLELFQYSLDGVKHVKVSGSSHITLVRGEGKDGNGNLLLLILLHAKVTPLQGTIGKKVDTIGQWNRSSSGSLTSSVNDGFNSTIDLRQRNLKRNLDRMQSKLGCLPLLKGLEDKRHGAHVWNIQLLQYLGSLLVILGGGSTHQGKASKVDHSIDNCLAAGIIEVIREGTREVKSSRVDGDDTGTAALELSNQGDVMSIILGINVTLLKNDSDSRGSLGINAGIRTMFVIVPLEVGFVIFEDNIRGDWMPNGLVGKEDRFLHDDLLLALHGFLDGSNIVLSDHEEKGFQVLGGSSKPVLERHHECSSIPCLITRQELQDLWQSPQQLQHALLERTSILLLLLLHEISDNTLALSQILHGE